MDRNDPLIPMPWQMDDIRAYRAAKQSEAIKKSMELEQAMLNLEKAREETLAGKVEKAHMIGRMMEGSEQQGKYIPIGEDIQSEMLRTGGPSILKATQMQAELNRRNRGEKMGLLAMENELIGGRGIVPTEKYDYQGVSGETIRGQGVPQISNITRDVYQSDYKNFYDVAKFQGANDQQAHQMATQEAKQKAVKNLDKVTILLPTGGQIVSTPERIGQLRDAPGTPKAVRDAIIEQWGVSGNQSADNWIKSKIPRAVK